MAVLPPGSCCRCTTRLRFFCEGNLILEILSTRFNAAQYSDFALGFKVIILYSLFVNIDVQIL